MKAIYPRLGRFAQDIVTLPLLLVLFTVMVVGDIVMAIWKETK